VNPRQKAVFEAKQAMRLGTENPVCVPCGESNPLRLVLPTGHHPTGEKRDPSMKTPTCASCHQEAHFRARRDGVTYGVREGRVQARTSSRLRALASFLQMVVDYLLRWADELDGVGQK